jgi:hypothetical protein
MDNIVDVLQRLGFGEYEARAYVALLGKSENVCARFFGRYSSSVPPGISDALVEFRVGKLTRGAPASGNISSVAAMLASGSGRADGHPL